MNYLPHRSAPFAAAAIADELLHSAIESDIHPRVGGMVIRVTGLASIASPPADVEIELVGCQGGVEVAIRIKRSEPATAANQLHGVTMIVANDAEARAAARVIAPIARHLFAFA